ncbi:uncharacterized protein LOC110698893 [Chenopodium quinoa]|uniref:Uncharacterized protein n=1 Tax=Chenopodium quinoa TaxID=63459 RepID=A0A803LED8_CHEQI|nr:uncharacterized protein LOC110698893 [Chenopodium quinoa]
MERNNTRMVRIDEDELECLRKLAEPIVQSRIVRIDEDELECLRKLAEPSTTDRAYRQKVTPVTNTKSRLSSNNNDDNKIFVHDDEFFHRVEKKVVTQVPGKKLESKKSEDINESAEKFIQKFKQQLLLQRLESIENVEKMLERGL